VDKSLIEYFIEHTDERFEKLERKIDTVVAFRWQIIGGSVVISTLFSLVIAVYFGK
jgi:tetrahydromethanopterin S-methyltransferase subunit G